MSSFLFSFLTSENRMFVRISVSILQKNTLLGFGILIKGDAQTNPALILLLLFVDFLQQCPLEK